MTPKTVNLADLDREALADLAPHALVLIPVGACEQHGPHLPLATDSLLVSHIAREVAESLSADIPTVVTPTMPFGYSAYHIPDGVTLSVSVETLLQVLADVMQSLRDCGFRRMFILNGHGGNEDIVKVATRSFGSVDHDLQLGAGSYWSMAWDYLIAAVGSEGHRVPGHAGRFETAAIQVIRPDLVSKPPKGSTPPNAIVEPTFHAEHRAEWRRRWPRGFTDDPAAASLDIGKRFLEAAIAGTLRTLRGYYAPK